MSKTFLLGFGLFVFFFAVHLPFRSQYLVNWDSVQFALGTVSFDLQYHQPHPPGYIGYVALGYLLNHLTSDPNASLTLVSALSGGAASATLFVLGRRFLAERYALLSAILFGTSPLVWYYSRVALTYAVEVALALPIAWACYCARSDRSVRHIWIASLLLAVLGALRPSAFVLLLPLWALTIWPFPGRVRVRALGLLAAGTLLWLLPLVWLSGGPVEYVRTGLALAGLVGGETSVLALNLPGLARNLLIVLGLAIGLNLGLALIAIARRRRGAKTPAWAAGDQLFFLVWAGPALLTYLLGHTGQLGYALPLLPIGFLWLGKALQDLFGVGSTLRRGLSRGPVLWRPRLGIVTVVAGLLLGNLLAAAWLPDSAQAIFQQAQKITSDEASARATLPPLTGHIRQFDLTASDAYWHDLLDFIRLYDARRTAILAVPAGTGSGAFRHLGYYLPDYPVYALGWDRRGAFGHLFTAHRGVSNYRVEGLKSSRCWLHLPPNVTKIVIPDPEIVAFWDPAEPRLEALIGEGAWVTVMTVPAGSVLVIAPGDGDAPRIQVRPRESLPPETDWAGADYCVP